MVIFEELCEYFGFSEYEARVYEFLVKEGPSTARKISMSCDVPRTKIYETLRKLIEHEVVVEVPTNPKRFMALSPNETLRPLLKSQRAIIRRFNALISSLQRSYERSLSLANIVRGEIWFFIGQDAARNLSDILLRARRKVTISLSWKSFIQFYSAFGRLLDKLNEKGVEILVYFFGVSAVNRRFCQNIGLNYKVVNSNFALPMVLLNVDDKFSLIYLASNTCSSFPEGIMILFQSQILRDLIDEILQKDAVSIEEKKLSNKMEC